MPPIHMPAPMNPLSAEQAQQFQALLGTMSPVQQAWVSGYLAAKAESALPASPGPAPAAAPAPFTILYGSQTGNAKHVAQDLAEQAKARGFETRLVNMADFKPNKLKDERFLAIVVSTYGEGEPPEPAEKLYAFLASRKAPRLDGARIAVLGLGDSSYEFFCKTAVDFQDRLTALGATVLRERLLLDVDYDDHTASWITEALDLFEPELKTGAPANNVVSLPGAVAPATYSKKTPFEAEISLVQKITGRDSTRDIRHVEISLEGSGLSYRPGDSLGVFFQNAPDEVDALLAALALDGAEEVTLGETRKALRAALLEDLELTQSYPGFVKAYAAATGNDRLSGLEPADLRAYLADRQIYDIVLDHPAPIPAQALVDALRKMQPRLYSIASSQSEVEDEVHLTLGVVAYEAHGRAHLGGASGHLGRRMAEGDTLRVFVEENDGFRLPADPNTPVIMIGPGTGIAPFRAFLQERDATEAEGQNWLFFGNPHFTQDFLYQTEVQAWLKSGLLDRVSLAFSRDQSEKIYVQDRLRESGAEVWEWLERGAHIYVCGDGSHMARDVEATLLALFAEQGGLTADEASARLQNLKEEKRYQRDVY